MTDDNKNTGPEKQENRSPDNVIRLYADNEIANDVVKHEVDNKECAVDINHEVGDDKTEAVNAEIEGKENMVPDSEPVDPKLTEASMHTLPTISEFAEPIAPEGRNRHNEGIEDRGEFRSATDGTAAIGTASGTMRVLGWICTILTAFVSPLFAIAGIIFGVIANRQARGSGNAIIFTNIVLAAINILFGFFLIGMFRNMMGY